MLVPDLDIAVRHFGGAILLVPVYTLNQAERQYADVVMRNHTFRVESFD